MLELNGTLLIIAISFIIFLLIMQKIFYAPMTEVRKSVKITLKTTIIRHPILLKSLKI